MEEAGWPENLPQMKVIDDLLRCGICFDYYNIAMIIPQCSHNYCSLCIRKFLSYKTQCPTCCVAAVEPDLRNNRVLDELVKNFNAARQHLFQFILESPPISPPTLRSNHSSGKLHSARSMGCSRLKQENAFMDNFLVKTKTLKSRRAESSARGEKEVIQMEGQDRAVETGSAAMGPTSSGSQSTTASPRRSTTPGMKEVVKVDCPVCGVGIPQQFINRHLDSCLTSDEKKESLRSSTLKRKPMAKVVYNLLSDRDLRKKLKDAGLSSQGPKQQLIKRHLEFVHMYNAQCDSLNPKSVAEIVKEIEQNEKTRAQLHRKPGENSMTFSKDQSEQEIEGIHSDYRQKHKNEFQFLIDQVKNRWQKSAKKDITEEREDLSALPAGLEDDVGKQCPEQLSAVDQSLDADIVDEAGANLSVDAVNLNDRRASPAPDAVIVMEGEANVSPYVIVNEGCTGSSPDVFVNEGGADELPLQGTPIRSASPSFPLSPQSKASSSSSDILRDLEEVRTDESSDFSLPEAKVGKRKSKSPRPQESGSTRTRSKRSRK